MGKCYRLRSYNLVEIYSVVKLLARSCAGQVEEGTSTELIAATYDTNCHGAKRDVCAELPELCAANLLLRSLVRPMYVFSGELSDLIKYT